MIRFEIFAAVIAAAAAVGCPSDPEPQPPAPAVYLEQEYEEAYMNMKPSGADDFHSPVRCLYTGRLLPLGKTVRLSETAEAAVVTGTADAAVADAENRWQETDSFSVDKAGPCTVFVRRKGEEAFSRYRFIAVGSFGSVSQLTVRAETAAAVGWASEVIEYIEGKDLTSFTDPQRALGLLVCAQVRGNLRSGLRRCFPRERRFTDAEVGNAGGQRHRSRFCRL